MCLSSRLNTSPKISIDTTEHLIRSLANTLMSAAKMAGDVADKVFLLAGGTAKNLPQAVRLNVILRCNSVLLGDDGTGPLLVLLASFDGLVGERAESGGVVGVGAIVAVDVHVAIAVRRVEGLERTVDGDLLVVATQTVAVCVGVGEEASLEDGVGGGLDAGDHVGWREGGLFNLREVVLRVLVQGEAAEAAQRNILLRPDFS